MLSIAIKNQHADKRASKFAKATSSVTCLLSAMLTLTPGSEVSQSSQVHAEALPRLPSEVVAELQAAKRGEEQAWARLRQRLIRGERGALNIDGRQQSWLAALAVLGAGDRWQDLPAPAQRRLAWHLPAFHLGHWASDHLLAAWRQALDRGDLAAAKHIADHANQTLTARQQAPPDHNITWPYIAHAPLQHTLPHPGPTQQLQRSPSRLTSSGQLAQPPAGGLFWRISNGQLLALDPWGEVLWQRSLGSQSLVAWSAQLAVLQAWQQIIIIHHRGEVTEELHLPPSFDLLGLSGDRIWAQRGKELWGWDLKQQRLRRLAFDQPALTAPLRDQQGQELWLLRDRWVLLKADGAAPARFPHALLHATQQAPSTNFEPPPDHLAAVAATPDFALQQLGDQVLITTNGSWWLMQAPEPNSWHTLIASHDDINLLQAYRQAKHQDRQRFLSAALLAAMRSGGDITSLGPLDSLPQRQQLWAAWHLSHYGEDIPRMLAAISDLEVSAQQDLPLPTSSEHWQVLSSLAVDIHHIDWHSFRTLSSLTQPTQVTWDHHPSQADLIADGSYRYEITASTQRHSDQVVVRCYHQDTLWWQQSLELPFEIYSHQAVARGNIIIVQMGPHHLRILSADDGALLGYFTSPIPLQAEWLVGFDGNAMIGVIAGQWQRLTTKRKWQPLAVPTGTWAMPWGRQGVLMGNATTSWLLNDQVSEVTIPWQASLHTALPSSFTRLSIDHQAGTFIRRFHAYGSGIHLLGTW